MTIPINDHSYEGGFNYNVEQLASFVPMAPEVTQRLQGTAVEGRIWRELHSCQYLLLPYSGAPATTIANIKVEIPTEEDEDEEGSSQRIETIATDTRERMMRRFCDVAAVFRNQKFFAAAHSPAWIAMLLDEENPGELEEALQPLNTSHVLLASLAASHIEGQPLRSMVSYAREMEFTERRQRILRDSLGRRFPQFTKDATAEDGLAHGGDGHLIPETENVSRTEFDNQYWTTSDHFSRDASDTIIVGDTPQSGTLITRKGTFAGVAHPARGIIIPA